VQLQFAFKTLAGGVDLQIRFAGEDAAHVIVIGFLAEAPDVRARDDVVVAAGRGDVDGKDLDVRVAVDEFIDQLLCVGSAGAPGSYGYGSNRLPACEMRRCRRVANSLALRSSAVRSAPARYV